MSVPFEYRARDKTGRAVSGVIDAEDSAAAVRRLRQEGLYVSSVRPASRAGARGAAGRGAGAGAGALGALGRGRRPSAADVALMCSQFAMMLRAGLTAADGLRLLVQQTSNRRLREALEAVRRDVSTGSSLARSFGRHGDVFPQLLVQMVEVGEVTGALEEVLNRTGAYYQREHELRAKVREALAYPTLVAIVALVVINVLLLFVLPTFVGFFRQAGMPLPLPTRVLLGVQEFTSRWWWAVAAAVVAAATALRQYVRTPRGRLERDRFLLRAPIFGGLVTRTVLARLTRTLGLGLRSGISMVEALRAAQRVVGNEAMAQAMAGVIAGVEKGQSVAKAMAAQKLFPELLVQMVAVGETTGSVEEMMEHLATRYDGEVERAVKTLISLLEPAIIIVLAGVVLLIVASVMLPLFQSAGLVQ
ncbi:MAG: type II secretion system F family protein [Limnochordaceae bacterium]|nr:type II secretion system F family protein [Limnochordaceae bacterium]